MTVIPEEAVEAAIVAAGNTLLSGDRPAQIRAALAAALPHLRAHQTTCTCPTDADVTPEMRSETGQHLMACPLSGGGLAAEVEPWLQQCGSCDAALPMGCTCPLGDYRNILLKVWRAYERSQAETKALAETATKLALALGRAEALKEVADEMGLSHAWQLDDPRINYVDVQIDKDTYRRLMAAREVGR